MNYLDSNTDSKDCANSPPITFGIGQVFESHKLNKAAGHDGIVNEHVMYGGLNLRLQSICVSYSLL